MKVTIIPIVIGAFGTVTKGLLKGLEDLEVGDWVELKKLWNMKVTIIPIIPIVIGAFGTVTKGLLKGLEDLEVGDWVETIQTTALLKTSRILTRVLETWGDLLAVTQTPVKDHQLTLMWKTLMSNK